MDRVKDLKGQTFTRLTVLKFVGKDKRKKAIWLCVCRCGTRCRVSSNSLIQGYTKSCGCLNREVQRKTGKALGESQRVHGHTSRVKGRSYCTPEYAAYASAKYRCNNPSAPDYERYGGNGVEFCFSNIGEFIDALKTKSNPTGLRPQGKDDKGKSLYSLDRYPDKEGSYKRGNIRWATWMQQIHNRRPLRLRKEPQYVHAIRVLHSIGKLTQRAIAQRVGISEATVSGVVNGKLWKKAA